MQDLWLTQEGEIPAQEHPLRPEVFWMTRILAPRDPDHLHSEVIVQPHHHWEEIEKLARDIHGDHPIGGEMPQVDLKGLLR